jgi:hypothetical protein
MEVALQNVEITDKLAEPARIEQPARAEEPVRAEERDIQQTPVSKK